MYPNTARLRNSREYSRYIHVKHNKIRPEKKPSLRTNCRTVVNTWKKNANLLIKTKSIYEIRLKNLIKRLFQIITGLLYNLIPPTDLNSL